MRKQLDARPFQTYFEAPANKKKIRKGIQEHGVFLQKDWEGIEHYAIEVGSKNGIPITIEVTHSIRGFKVVAAYWGSASELKEQAVG